MYIDTMRYIDTYNVFIIMYIVFVFFNNGSHYFPFHENIANCKTSDANCKLTESFSLFVYMLCNYLIMFFCIFCIVIRNPDSLTNTGLPIILQILLITSGLFCPVIMMSEAFIPCHRVIYIYDTGD